MCLAECFFVVEYAVKWEQYFELECYKAIIYYLKAKSELIVFFYSNVTTLVSDHLLHILKNCC